MNTRGSGSYGLSGIMASRAIVLGMPSHDASTKYNSEPTTVTESIAWGVADLTHNIEANWCDAQANTTNRL